MFEINILELNLNFRMIRINIKKLHVDDLFRIEKQVPFSDNENFLILGLDSVRNNNLKIFIFLKFYIFYKRK